MVEITSDGFGGFHIFRKLESLQLVILLKIEIIQGYLSVVCHHKWRAATFVKHLFEEQLFL